MEKKIKKLKKVIKKEEPQTKPIEIKDKEYIYKDNIYKWTKFNFEYRIWSKKFIHEYELFEREFIKDSKNEFLKDVVKDNKEELSITDLQKHLSVDKITSLSNLYTDISTAKELFLYENDNMKNLLTTVLDEFDFPNKEDIDDELIGLALEVLEDFFMKQGRIQSLSIK